MVTAGILASLERNRNAMLLQIQMSSLNQAFFVEMENFRTRRIRNPRF
jgi:hypothetical protein